MNKEFVPYEEALALKELGYEGDIIGMYDEDKYLFTLHEQDDIEDEWLPAPLYQQSFRWFIERYNKLHAINIDLSDNLDNKVFVYTVEDELGSIIDRSEEYKNYEEAELACLRKLIEIVKQKKEDE